jgi:hypothetical protein
MRKCRSFYLPELGQLAVAIVNRKGACCVLCARGSEPSAACSCSPHAATRGGQLATDERNNVREEFREACGKPGAEVLTERSKVVVKHADCDLTGVLIKANGGGAAVPARSEGVVEGSQGGTANIEVDETTGNVTFTAGL